MSTVTVSADLMAALTKLADTIGRLNPGSGSRPRATSQLTVAEVCDELKVSPRTFHEWRAKGRAPKCLKLPNGELRISRADFDSWKEALREATR